MKATTLPQQAMSGNQLHDGDTLEIKNQWARITITIDVNPGMPVEYICDGDVVEGERMATFPKRFKKINDAISCAMASLAVFAQGRCD